MKMTFFLHLKGHSGSGCDYTMGCNQTLLKLKANTLEEALKEAKKEFASYYEYGIAEALIIPAEFPWTVPVTTWDKELKALREKRQAEKEFQDKKSLYEKLKAELGEE